MSYIKQIIVIFLLIVITPSCHKADLRKWIEESKFKEEALPTPPYKRTVLNNGMVVYLMEDKELPLIEVDVYIKTGSMYDNADKLGLSELTGGAVVTGGTEKMTGDEIDKEIDFLGGDINIGIGIEHGKGFLSVLKKDIDRGLEIMSDVLMHPIFNETKILIKKNEMIENIRRQNDHPQSIAEREFAKLIYGRDHFYSRTPTIGMIEAITREDIIAYYNTYFKPNNIIIGVTGDFETEEMLKKIEYLFGKWGRAETIYPQIPKAQVKFKKSVNYIFKDQPQTLIRIGHFGTRNNNPDRYALDVLNEILGGSSFQSRLMKEVRSDKGLAYAIWSIFGYGNKDMGIFKVACETKSSSSTEVISTIVNNIKRLTTEYVSLEELQTVKDSIINSFIFKMDSKQEMLNRMIYLEFFGLPMDFYETYRENVRKVTKEDVLRVAKEYFHPDELVILAVGNAERFNEPLTVFGDVTTIKLDSY